MTYNELAELLKQEGGELEVSFKVISQNVVVFGNNNPHKDVITLKNDAPIKWYSDKEQPVSDDFEKALASEWKDYIDRGAATVDALEENTQELAFAKGFYRGAKWKEQKMMAKAIDAKVSFGKSLTIPWLGCTLDKMNLKQKDKVKVIIIKED